MRDTPRRYTPELSQPAWIYVETRGGVGVGGSDDHAGADIGRTWSQTPGANTVEEYLEHVRAGRLIALRRPRLGGEVGARRMAIAVRTDGQDGGEAPLDPAAVLRIAERVMSEGDARAGALGADPRPAGARALLGAWLRSVGLDVGRGAAGAAAGRRLPPPRPVPARPQGARARPARRG